MPFELDRCLYSLTQFMFLNFSSRGFGQGAENYFFWSFETGHVLCTEFDKFLILCTFSGF